MGPGDTANSPKAVSCLIVGEKETIVAHALRTVRERNHDATTSMMVYGGS